jgi:hypothetical protein
MLIYSLRRIDGMKVISGSKRRRLATGQWEITALGKP